MSTIRIGETVDFADAHGLRYRGVVMDVRAGTAFVAVRGYPFLFPAIGITAAQLTALNAAQEPT